MTARSLFNIILKVFGLFFLREIVNTVPQLIASLTYFTKSASIEQGLWTFIFTAVVIAFYTFLVLQLLFKTNYFIDKLRLDQGFNQEEFSLNISTSRVLEIALIVTAGLILISEIPNLCRQIFLYVQEKRTTYGMTKPDISYFIISAVKILIALLLIGERNKIINFVEKKPSTTRPSESE